MRPIMRLVSLDTETTGLDLRHGARPFFVTTYSEGTTHYWEWDVDPLTRMPKIPKEDKKEIYADLFNKNTLRILHNSKFDYTALNQVGVISKLTPKQMWVNTHDTLTASHLLSTNTPHDLTFLASHYLGIDIKPQEATLKQITMQAVAIAKRQFPEWKLASKDLSEDMPSAKGTLWKFDTWVPRAVAKALKYPRLHEFWHALREYANMDSLVTWHLWEILEDYIKDRNLEAIYQEKLKAIPVAYAMENDGVTFSLPRMTELVTEFSIESTKLAEKCKNIADCYNYDLVMPKGKANDSIRDFITGPLGVNLPLTDKGSPSLNKGVLESVIENLDRRSMAYHFLKAIQDKSKRDTALSYMASYQRFAKKLTTDFYLLHPSLNLTGSNTLRCTSSNPNEQNISKKKGFNLRKCFGPREGREWWSLDAKNIELRIPAYEANEIEMIKLFEKPNDPPYFGSNHLLVCHILHPKLFEECRDAHGQIDGRIFKSRYESSWYQYVKNGNFAVQYGAMEASGTADRAYHVKGGQRMVQGFFKNMKSLNDKMVHLANTRGYVETIPDKSVDPDRGYPIVCKRTQWGNVLPTTPLNYHVQGTAMWWMFKAMIRCYDLLESWKEEGYFGFITMQIHDELVFDLPKKADPVKDPKRSNLSRIKKIKEVMELSGVDIGIPTPVSCEYHPDNWSEAIELL